MHFLGWSNSAKLCWGRFDLLELKSTEVSSLGSSRNVSLVPALPIKIVVLPFPPGDNKEQGGTACISLFSTALFGISSFASQIP